MTRRDELVETLFTHMAKVKLLQEDIARFNNKRKGLTLKDPHSLMPVNTDICPPGDFASTLKGQAFYKDLQQEERDLYLRIAEVYDDEPIVQEMMKELTLLIEV